MDYGIDWISIRQRHPRAPEHVREMVLRFDMETKQARESGRGYVHKGSFDDSVYVKSYGNWVEWSGNPARWGKADNLSPISMTEALTIINRHMDALSLPRFTAANGAETELFRQDETRLDEVLGAILTRVDLCKTAMTGCAASSHAFLRAMGTATYRGKPGQEYGGTTFTWGKSPNIFMKWYLKGTELLAHTGKGFQVHKQYRRALADWCSGHGVVRWEVSLGRNALRRYGLRMLCDWNQLKAEGIAEKLRGEMKVGATYTIDQTQEAFLAAGFGTARAATAAGYVSRWYSGHDVWASFPDRLDGHKTRSAYNYRNWIKGVMGIDIRSQPNIATLTTRIREVELAPLSLPSWYRYERQQAA